MKKIKIVHLITSLKTGGAETVLVDLLRNINKNSFDNIVIYFHYGPNVEKLKNLGIETYQIKGLICKYDPIFIIRLFLLIKKIRPNLIHSLLWSANILGTIISNILKIPIACALHGKGNFFRNFLDKMILPKADSIITVSDSLVNELKVNNNWFSFTKIKVIKNGIDIDEINSKMLQINSDKQNFKINKDTFVVGTVGRFIPCKNHEMLIDSFVKLSNDFSNVHLILIGYGPLEDSLKSKVKQLGIYDKVSFIKTDNAWAFYPIFDCFTLTSQNEGSPLVVLEAMFFGLPCLVTNYDKNQIVRDSIDGYIVNNNDIQDLYLKLKKIFLNEKERLEFGSNAKQNVYSNFDIKKVVNSYENVFRELV